MMKKKIALFGGTFDPIHLGHTTVVSSAKETIEADKVIFVPAKRSVLKEALPVAGIADRLEMISLAISGYKDFELSDYELKKSKPSYTLETVRYFQTEFGQDASICWLLGADSIEDLPYWYKVTELIDECNLCVMFRAGCEKPDFSGFAGIWGVDRIEKLQQNVIQTPLVNVSSTEIRERLAAGESVSDMLCPEVEEYISNKGLYRAQEDT